MNELKDGLLLSAQEEVDNFTNELLKTRLEMCTEREQAVFKSMYPKMPAPKDRVWAIQQCTNTINKKLKA